jgi:hypothetical protein
MHLYMFISHLQNVALRMDFKRSLCESTIAEYIAYLNLLIGALLETSWFLYQNISDPDSILCSDIWGSYDGPMKNGAM